LSAIEQNDKLMLIDEKHQLVKDLSHLESKNKKLQRQIDNMNEEQIKDSLARVYENALRMAEEAYLDTN
jgi:regulator of replication initiation timing